ncbi:MAG: ABC transporter permease [Coriobacteriales bacterium]|jgi:ABC-2 type transport system permease protein|nr:ABC transporter permease [Coriobacteriales bacterium]
MRDTLTLLGRLIRHVLRSPDTIITTALMPVAMMLLFVYVFGGAVGPSLGSDVSYVNYQLPGIALIAVASGISYTAMRLWSDMQKGLFARFSSMPIKRSAMLWAHVLTSLAANMLTLVIIVLVALPLGFRSSAGVLNWLGVAGILVLFTLALTWVATIPGLTAHSMEGATAFSYPLIFLPFLSSAFVPTETMPAALRVFAESQPVTPIVATLRALLNAEPLGSEIWLALAWCVGIAAVSYCLATRAYRRAM